MSDINVAFCNAELATVRQMAKEAHIVIPKGLTTWHDASSRQYQIFSKDGRETGRVWISAYCASEAKAKYITNLIEAKQKCSECDCETWEPLADYPDTCSCGHKHIVK